VATLRGELRGIGTHVRAGLRGEWELFTVVGR
jgi:hypothetical protein